MSWQARSLKIMGYTSAGAGTVTTIEEKIQKSPSWLGPALTAGGLAVPLIQATLQKAIPAYAIPNLPPNTISLGLNQCDDYTSLAPKGVAPQTLSSRRIDPLN